MYNLHIFNAHLHTTAYYIPRIYLNSTSTINNFNNIIETKDPMPDSLFIYPRNYFETMLKKLELHFSPRITFQKINSQADG